MVGGCSLWHLQRCSRNGKACPHAREGFLFVVEVEGFNLRLVSADKAPVGPCAVPAVWTAAAPLPSAPSNAAAIQLEIPLLSPIIYSHMESLWVSSAYL